MLVRCIKGHRRPTARVRAHRCNFDGHGRRHDPLCGALLNRAKTGREKKVYNLENDARCSAPKGEVKHDRFKI